MNLLTIASRADLGSSITKALLRAHEQLNAADDFLLLVDRSLSLTEQQCTYHLSSSLMGALGFVEAAINDIALRYLVAYPGHLGSKTIELGALAKAGSIIEILEEKANRHISDLAYKRFEEYSKEVIRIISSNGCIDEGLVDRVAEIKATRDIYAHAGGFVNARYVSKAGATAREKREGTKLKLDLGYVRDSLGHLRDYLLELEKAIPETVRKQGRAATFCEMWKATVMEQCVPFEEAWIVVDDNMVRPNDERQQEAYWSHSERMLLDFFLGVYSPDHPRRRHDFIMSIERWPANSNERKVMQSWVETPFWF